MEKKHQLGLSIGGLFVALGVVYGDIGTSPMYVMRALIEGNGGLGAISDEFIIGVVSLVFWTVTLLTTVKYVMLALEADNHHEGGIFALYTLVRKAGKYIIIPAMIGGAALLADGVLTPAVTVTTAIEGLRDIPLFYQAFGDNQTVIIEITLTILAVLFFVQRFGTEKIGRTFGPIMFGWFLFLALMGLGNIPLDLNILRAINPLHAIRILFSGANALGIFVLGSIFLATTGAEALYSDMGHVGKDNIRWSWPYVFTCLMLNYMGQGAWVMNVHHHPELVAGSTSVNPFFAIMPKSLLVVGVLFATVAAIIASQSLITGSFSLVSEAIKLKLLPRLKITYPGKGIGQSYIPAVNTLLWIMTSCVVLGFKTSSHMEAAYGLSITVTMLMTTFLLWTHLRQSGVRPLFAHAVLLFFGPIETIFLISSLTKFFHGGYVAVGIALLILVLMYIWHHATTLQSMASQEVSLTTYLPQIQALHEDESLPYYQSNVVFLVSQLEGDVIPRQYIYSILDKKPKRAKAYWFVHITVTDQPYTQEYTIDMLGTDFIVIVNLYLGYKIPQRINVYIRQIITDLMADERLPKQPQRYTSMPGREVGDFRFIFISEELSSLTNFSHWDREIMRAKQTIKRFTVTPESWFGLQFSEVTSETVPLAVAAGRQSNSFLTEIK
ncbi:MAG: KUP/HAK/KT family potassium transporter [Aerococcus sp.]|nr:KUP/HAK/KT family potassium transporter [Aerococcus sp.]